MRTVGWVAAIVVWMLCASILNGQEAALEHPSAVIDLYDADEGCWMGMNAEGTYPWPVIPDFWLVGPPPSEMSAVTIAKDHWIELLFPGEIVAGQDNDVDITMTEWGRAGEMAIVFLTDGGDQEHPLALVQADGTGGDLVTDISLYIPRIPLSFVPRAIRLVAVDNGGAAPGFDIGQIQTRISHACGIVARYPTPIDGATGVRLDETLFWTPACADGDQCVYLSDVRSDVEAADPACRYVVGPSDANSFQVPPLELDRRYYWRIDIVRDGDSGRVVAPGEIWSFTTADHTLIEDFDRYDGVAEFNAAWRPRGFAGIHLAQSGILQSCHQSMQLDYFYDTASSSEACRDFDSPQDWTTSGARILRLWLYGDIRNATSGDLYVALDDGKNLQRVFYRGDSSILTDTDWTQWPVALDAFTDVNLAHVVSLAVGLRPARGGSAVAGDGTVFVDDIELHHSLCLGDDPLAADLTADCAVDYLDLGQMAASWLDDRVDVVPVAAPNEPRLWYEFEGNSYDSIRNSHAQTYGRPTYGPGVYGQAIHFASIEDRVVLYNAFSLFRDIREAVTLSFWLNADDSEHLNDTICCSNYVYGESSPSIGIVLGCWRNPGQYRWDCGWPWSSSNRIAGHHQYQNEWAGRWNHWAFTKDITVEGDGPRGRMNIYLNGMLYDSRSGTDSPIENVTSLEIGGGWYGHYDGMMDDFRIYDYALSQAEVAYLASDGTGRLERPLRPQGDLDGSDRVDLADFSILAGQWLDVTLWP